MLSLPSSCLRDSVGSGLQNSERALVAHSYKTAQGQLEDHAALERHKVTHVLQQEELGPVVVAVTEVTRN